MTLAQSASTLTIVEMTSTHATDLSPRIAAIDPWHRLGISSANILAMLTTDEPAQVRMAILADDQPVGAFVVRKDWLLGPYLRHLSIMENARGHGGGRLALEWLDTFARQHDHRNIWLCVSGFNTSAQRFYASYGFEIVTTIPDLVVPGETELLMRRQLNSGLQSTA